MEAWEQFLQIQESDLGIETVQKWLRSLKVKRFDACNLYLEANDSFQALWFEEHIRGKAQAKLVNGNHKKIKIHLAIANTPLQGLTKKGKRKQAEISPSSFQLVFDELDPSCSFENFIVNEDNQLPHKLFLEIATPSPQPQATQLGSFNPIYIYGEGGSGKTHLLMSMAHALRAKGLKTIYARADTFTNHVVTAIRAGEMSTFRQAYRNIDVLLIDDIHVFSRRGATQEEFFHTFNTLHLEGKQIILSANGAPQELQFIEPRLISRFEWGIALPVKPLQKKEEMCQILNSKAQALNFPLPSHLVDFLVNTFVSNAKALTKALSALILRLHLDRHHSIHALALPTIKTILADLILEEAKTAMSSDKIIQAVAEQYGIRVEDLLGKAQTRDCALPRQLAMYLCRHQLKLPYMKIGELFSRDHSTVMSAIKQIQKGLDQDDCDLANAYRIIQKKIKT